MQEKTTIARPYAKAIFEIASEEKKLAEWSAMLEMLESIVMNQQMKQLIIDPRLDSSAQADFILSLCNQYLTEMGSNLVQVLANAKRLVCIPEIKKLYEQFRADAEGITKVNITSAYTLTAEQQSSISKLMEKRLGNKVEINSKVDNSLMGGMVIQADDMVIDASVKGRLNTLSNALIN